METPPRLAWNAHEYEPKQRSTDWYWTLGVVAIVGATIAVILNNVLFAILIVLGAATLALYTVRMPNVIVHEIHERGIRVGTTLYPHRTLESFWIEDEPERPQPRIFLKTSALFTPAVVILLDPTCSIDDARECLRAYLREEEYIEPLPYKIMEYFGLY